MSHTTIVHPFPLSNIRIRPSAPSEGWGARYNPSPLLHKCVGRHPAASLSAAVRTCPHVRRRSCGPASTPARSPEALTANSVPLDRRQSQGAPVPTIAVLTAAEDAFPPADRGCPQPHRGMSYTGPWRKGRIICRYLVTRRPNRIAADAALHSREASRRQSPATEGQFQGPVVFKGIGGWPQIAPPVRTALWKA